MDIVSYLTWPAREEYFGFFRDGFLYLVLDGRLGGMFRRELLEFLPGRGLDAFVPFLFHLGPIFDDVGTEMRGVRFCVGHARARHSSEQSSDEPPGLFDGLGQLS